MTDLMMQRSGATVAGLVVVVLVGCSPSPEGGNAASPPPDATSTTAAPSDPNDPASSTACVEAMQAADEEMKRTNGTVETAVMATVTTCITVAEWVGALELYPGAVGLSGPEFIDPSIDLGVLCHLNEAPVCDDARSHGLNELWQ